VLQTTKEQLVHPASSSEDYAIIQRFILAFVQQENTPVEAIFPSSDTVFVAEIRGDIVGAIVAHKRDDTHWQLTLCYVTGGQRRSGIGRALVNAVIDHVGPGIELQVKATIGGQGFYQKLGFQAGNEFLCWKYLTT
jgi:ribosomal protein S18 acetylase RimI-like enzyme